MKYSVVPAATLFGSSVITLMLLSRGAMAQSVPLVTSPVQQRVVQNPSQVETIARQVTVKIDGQAPGTGVIIARQEQTYFVLTAAHVIATEDEYEVVTPDGQKHRLDYKLVRKFPDNLDLAIIQFNSANSYPVVVIGRSAQLKESTPIYVAGFPHADGGLAAYQFSTGTLAAVVTRPVGKGYTLVYYNDTFTGMSGGPILDGQGQLVGIHGASKTAYTESQGISPEHGSKVGLNLGIPVDSFLRQRPQVLGDLNLPVPPSAIITNEMTASDYFLLGADQEIAGNSKAALVSYQKALLLKPDYADALFARANIRYFSFSDFKSAITDYDQALRLNPNLVPAYLHRGVMRWLSNDLQGAINDLNQAIRLNPTIDIAYSNRGTIRTQLGDLRGAMNDLKQAIRLNPNNAIAYHSRGNVHRGLGDFNNTIADYDQAIRRNPNFAEAYYNRGLTRAQLGDLKTAILDFDQALRLKPNFASAYNNRGNVHQALGDLKSAILDYDQALKLDSRHVNAYSNRGLARADSGNLTGAITDFDQVLQLDPKDASAYHNRGLTRVRLGDLKGAIADLQKAADLARAQGDNRLYELAMANLKRIQP
jgi:tetratricopeptide (TPR) repeat protein/S1-C subfamily serine protease